MRYTQKIRRDGLINIYVAVSESAEGRSRPLHTTANQC